MHGVVPFHVAPAGLTDLWFDVQLMFIRPLGVKTPEPAAPVYGKNPLIPTGISGVSGAKR
jgi:hypothetical protein